MTTHKSRRVAHRSTTGIRPGEKVSEYGRMTIRLPEDTRDDLEALSKAQQCPQWRIIVDALQGHMASHRQARRKP
jgi:hypothetical protein